MKFTVRVVGLLIGAAAFAGAASSAHAQTEKPRGLDFTVRNEATALTPQGTAGSVKLDTRKGRWGVTLNFDEPKARDATANDVQAGAYFRVTPKLRIGGAVALGEKERPPYRSGEPVDGRPRVRLETAFKF
ncbi:MAG: NtrZ family periplasmic regulatory protein [Phenylobacterium sp.]